MSMSKLLSALLAIAAGLHSLPAVAAGSDWALTILVENVSNDRTLKLRDGGTKAVPTAPGAYAVVSRSGTVFQEGKPAFKNGLQSLAEDGEAEDLIGYLKKANGVKDAGLFVPGQAVTIKAAPGDRLVFATMFVESNDLFYGPNSAGIVLFTPAGVPITGDVTSQVKLWDAGTEVNEAPGLGPNQAPRQKAVHTGVRESAPVRPVSDGFSYPAVSAVIRVTISK